MTNNQLTVELELHPERKICPNCGGAGELLFPVGCKIIECEMCHGVGTVLKEQER